ncbi:MAG: TRAP transporter large permease [Proteobacteria bacterium]|nr:TRAP transporter large permease [Pseudomonadota bacterium]
MELIAVYLFMPFVALLVLGVPVAFSLGLACVGFLVFSGTRIPMIVLATEMYGSIDSFTLLALPTFVLSGELLNRCDLTDKLVVMARQLVGWMRGGLAHVTVVASMFFAGINGSALADAASIGPIMIPSMIKEKYPRDFAAAVVAAASIIGPIIPPSIPLVIIGGQLQISIGGLLVGGVIPGILIGSMLMGVCYVIARWKRYGEVQPFEGFGPLLRSGFTAGPALLIPFLILGGMMFGIFSPTEAGTVTVLYTIAIGTLFYRTLTWRKLWASLSATAGVTAASLLIVAAAVMFGHIVTFYQMPQALLALMMSLTTDWFGLLMLVIALFIAVGMFMDPVANMIILGPLLYPICVNGLGMHPIQYGMFLMIGLLLGILHPPIGLILFVVAPIAKVTIERLSITVLPFLILELCFLVMIGVFPEITLFLPRLAGFVT